MRYSVHRSVRVVLICANSDLISRIRETFKLTAVSGQSPGPFRAKASCHAGMHDLGVGEMRRWPEITLRVPMNFRKAKFRSPRALYPPTPAQLRCF